MYSGMIRFKISYTRGIFFDNLYRRIRNDLNTVSFERC